MGLRYRLRLPKEVMVEAVRSYLCVVSQTRELPSKRLDVTMVEDRYSLGAVVSRGELTTVEYCFYVAAAKLEFDPEIQLLASKVSNCSCVDRRMRCLEMSIAVRSTDSKKWYSLESLSGYHRDKFHFTKECNLRRH